MTCILRIYRFELYQDYYLLHIFTFCRMPLSYFLWFRPIYSAIYNLYGSYAFNGNDLANYHYSIIEFKSVVILTTKLPNIKKSKSGINFRGINYRGINYCRVVNCRRVNCRPSVKFTVCACAVGDRTFITSAAKGEGFGNCYSY